MSRNRKYQTAAARFGPALKALVLCALFGSAGLGYVWLQEQIQVLSKRIAAKELQLESLRNQNIQLVRQLGELRSPRMLEARVHDLAPGLGIPQPDQVVRLVETHPSAPVLMAGHPSNQAGQRNEAVR